MGELWNNGRILTFNQYLHRFFTGSVRTTYSAITTAAFGNDGTAYWASQAEIFLGSSFAEWNRRRGEARNIARQQVQQAPPPEEDDVDMSDGEDGDEAPTTTTNRETGGVQESKSGGRRKKKTRKRRKKTRRRKKMKGGKKTKSKRKKKKKSKTRKKRGGGEVEELYKPKKNIKIDMDAFKNFFLNQEN
tara:strand:+ start:100 stop:666 length:567 start_codon:yes stop_codon:yes gene_type:complete